ncbi:MAG: tail fiber domain-containing protein, partial [Candidatus Parcubacteria bacterium]|nr:tail fiber domain-containing protein [Candidatus Parcubacteria bacterium]
LTFGGTYCFPSQGCTGKGSATAGDVGKYLKVSDDSPFTYSFDTPTGGGGTGWASSTDPTSIYFTGSGNVGIGTTSPYAKLSVVGEAVAQYFTATSITATSTFSTGGLAVGTSQFVVQQNSGNVGIGTTTPLSKLQVFGALPKFYLSDTNGALDNKHWFMENSAGVLSFGTTTDTLAVSGTRALSITNSGNVGIGTTSPATKLDVQGTAMIYGLTAAAGTPNTVCINATTKELTENAGTSCSVSSIRFKKDIQSLDEGLDFVNQLKPVSYTMKADNTEGVGFIAEDIEKLDKKLVSYTSDGLPNSVRYEQLTAVLTKAIQELDQKVSLLSSAASSTSPNIEPGLISTLVQNIMDMFKSAYNLVIEDGLLKISHIIVDKLTTKELCVGDTCVNEEQLKILLEKNGLASPVAPVSAQEPAPSPEPTPEPASVAEPTSAPESTPAPTPVVEPVPAPEIAPAVEPTPVESVPVAATPTE